jgi:hypothetical protein
MVPISGIAPYTSLIAFLIGLPTLIGTYYQTWKGRQESRLARQALVYSENCLEFLLEDGTTINVVPLGTLHTLPKTGDVVLLPGAGDSAVRHSQHAAYRVARIEYIYSRIESRNARSGHAKLAKAVAHVQELTTQ